MWIEPPALILYLYSDHLNSFRWLLNVVSIRCTMCLTALFQHLMQIILEITFRHCCHCRNGHQLIYLGMIIGQILQLTNTYILKFCSTKIVKLSAANHQRTCPNYRGCRDASLGSPEPRVIINQCWVQSRRDRIVVINLMMNGVKMWGILIVSIKILE